MMNQCVRYVGLSFVALTVIACEAERVVKRSDLPPAVQRAISSEEVGWSVRELTAETNGEATLYEAELAANGRTRDLLIDSDGQVVEVEEEVALSSLTEATLASLRELADGRTINHVESVTRNGRVVMYEAEVGRGFSRTDIEVAAE